MCCALGRVFVPRASWLGLAWLGLGLAWLGFARLGLARLGLASFLPLYIQQVLDVHFYLHLCEHLYVYCCVCVLTIVNAS